MSGDVLRCLGEPDSGGVEPLLVRFVLRPVPWTQYHSVMEGPRVQARPKRTLYVLSTTLLKL